MNTEIAIVGTGLVGIATAYYLVRDHRFTRLLLIDRGAPMAFTSAQSGENYRNWWPHPNMVALMNRSIDLLEEIAADSGNRIAMTRRGYSLVTRNSNIDRLITELRKGLGDARAPMLRYHTKPDTRGYRRPNGSDWTTVPDGVEVLCNQALIRDTFPSYAHDVRTVVHIRRGGEISGQQLGMLMLEYLREQGVKRLIGQVEGIARHDGFHVELRTAEGVRTVHADGIVNAAGPFAGHIARMLDVELPLSNVVQQKIAFDDREKTIPRDMPFSVDLDSQHIDWDDEERNLLREDPKLRWLTEELPGAIHCRPDGGEHGSWLKLGWALNRTPAPVTWEPPLDESFPEIVLRAAARLNPSLKTYYGRLPRAMHHYGGWYTMTEENWPLIGPMGPQGTFMNCAHSGFGTMAACAAGSLCAQWMAGTELPSYAAGFSLQRYRDSALIEQLRNGSRGIL